MKKCLALVRLHFASTPLSVALLLGLLGCGIATSCASAPLPGYFLDPIGSPHPECGAKDHMVGVGRSKTGKVDAEHGAREDLVRKISSSIQIETKRVVAIAAEAGVVNAHRTFNSTAIEKTEFTHGELIRMLGAPAEENGETFVLVCMDRSAASAVLEKELQKPLAAFTAAHDHAVEALAERNHAAFTTAYVEAGRAAPALLHGFAEVSAVGGSTGEGEARFRAAWNALLKGASTLRAQVAVKVSVDKGDLPGAQARAVGDAFRSALSGLGLKTEMTSGSCKQNAGAYLLKVKGEGNCAWGSLGYTCTPQFAVQALQCGTEERMVFDGELKDVQLRGNHARDQGQALIRSLKDLEGDLLAPHLRALFAAELPLD